MGVATPNFRAHSNALRVVGTPSATIAIEALVCRDVGRKTAALIEAQVKAVFFSSASSSLGLGARFRLKASTNCVPVHYVPVRPVGTDLPVSQEAKQCRKLARADRMQ